MPRASRSTKTTPSSPEDSTPMTSDVADSGVFPEESEETTPSTSPSPSLAEGGGKDDEATEKRRAYAKARRERIRAEQEAAGLVLRREYTTADGQTFTNKKDAARHIAMLNFITFVENQAPFQPIINEEVVTVGADAIAGWLEANSKAVGDFLRMVKA